MNDTDTSDPPIQNPAPPPDHPPPTATSHLEKDPNLPRPQKPSLGRIVQYHSHGHPVPAAWPAIIQRVNENGTLKLFVFGERGAVHADQVFEGSGVNQWAWPERV